MVNINIKKKGFSIFMDAIYYSSDEFMFIKLGKIADIQKNFIQCNFTKTKISDIVSCLLLESQESLEKGEMLDLALQSPKVSENYYAGILTVNGHFIVKAIKEFHADDLALIQSFLKSHISGKFINAVRLNRIAITCDENHEHIPVSCEFFVIYEKITKAKEEKLS